MPAFTLTPQYDNDPPTTLQIEAADDEAAIKAGRARLQETVELKPMVRSAKIGVGRGPPTEAAWLGVWDWTDDDCWTWTPHS